MWMALDADVYRRVHDLVLPSQGGTTQIDHVLVSVYGIFVVETKNIFSPFDFSESVCRKMAGEFRVLKSFDFSLAQPIVSPMSKSRYDKAGFAALPRAGVALFSASTASADFRFHKSQ